MTEVLFVEVSADRLETRVCELTESFYARGIPLQILVADQKQASRLDELLWTYRPDSFVPHAVLPGEEDRPSLPVVIATKQAKVAGIEHLLMTDYCSPELVGQFAQAIHLVVVDDKERREASRQYWVQLRDAGFTLAHKKLSSPSFPT
jgi:DNA polymerase-3 subunit chi